MRSSWIACCNSVALEETELERRIAKVEKLLARAEAKSGRKGYDETPADDFRQAGFVKMMKSDEALSHVAVMMAMSSVNHGF